MIYAQVGSMCNAHREEFDKVLGPKDARRFTVDEGLFGGAPRKRFFWTNARGSELAVRPKVRVPQSLCWTE